MIDPVKGTASGKHIDLDEDTGLAPGTRVEVIVRPKKVLSLEERKKKLAELCGSCADDPSFAAAVAKIVEERKRNMPREVNFDAAS